MWVKLDDKFHSNAKVYAVGNEGAGLFTRALSYCADHLTDGFVPAAWVQTLATSKLVDKLTAAGLWRHVDGGFYIDSYLELNASKSDVETRREQWREAGKRGADKRWGHGVPDGVGHRVGDGVPDGVSVSDSHGPVPVPVPVSTPAALQADSGGGQGGARAKSNGRTSEDFSTIGKVIPEVLREFEPAGLGSDDIEFEAGKG